MTTKNCSLSQRRFGALIAGAALAATAGRSADAPERIERRVSGLRIVYCREHFDSIENYAILATWLNASCFTGAPTAPTGSSRPRCRSATR